MSYYTGYGDDAAPAVAPAPVRAPTVAQRLPTPNKQALSIMLLSGLVWAPAMGGALIGGKLDDEHGRLWGAAAGAAFTFMTLRYIAQQMAPGST